MTDVENSTKKEADDNDIQYKKWVILVFIYWV